VNKNIIKSFVIVLLLAAVTYIQPATAAPEQATYTYATPAKDIPGLGNFAKVSDELYRGEQPTAEGFARLKKMGIKTIINLRAFHSDKNLIKGQGFYYLEIPMEANNIGDKESIAFLKAIADKKYAPFFVHCQRGADRTGTMVGLYRMTVQRWPREKVQGELSRFGFSETFSNLRKYLRNVNLSVLESEIKSAPQPEFAHIP
jgi:protein tyrosine/serine phosphatase